MYTGEGYVNNTASICANSCISNGVTVKLQLANLHRKCVAYCLLCGIYLEAAKVNEHNIIHPKNNTAAEFTVCP